MKKIHKNTIVELKELQKFYRFFESDDNLHRETIDALGNAIEILCEYIVEHPESLEKSIGHTDLEVYMLSEHHGSDHSSLGSCRRCVKRLDAVYK